jgi:hypothetical protein
MAANTPNKGAVKKNRSGTEIGGAWAKESPDDVAMLFIYIQSDNSWYYNVTQLH